MIADRRFTAGPLVDVDVHFRPFTVLVGPNGCGKTSVLRTLFQFDAKRAAFVASSVHVVGRVDPAAGDAAIADLLQTFPGSRTSAGELGLGPTRVLGILAAAHLGAVAVDALTKLVALGLVVLTASQGDELAAIVECGAENAAWGPGAVCPASSIDPPMPPRALANDGSALHLWLYLHFYK